ncbi:MAG: hypothetical protein ACTH4U_15260 [Pseudoalteromonas prydzensis]|uniref:hypothetical protein n=1 Tax=Pseudoalteromonas prydzensis TaxID=182141 RepID=UPI003F9BF8B7
MAVSASGVAGFLIFITASAAGARGFTGFSDSGTSACWPLDFSITGNGLGLGVMLTMYALMGGTSRTFNFGVLTDIKIAKIIPWSSNEIIRDQRHVVTICVP